MENKKDVKLSKDFWIILLTICIILVIVVTVGFILFVNREEEVITKTVKGGGLVLNYTGKNTTFTLEELKPTTDSVAIKDLTDDNYFDFSIDVGLDNAPSIEYEVAVVKDKKNSNISDDDIKIYLEQEKSGTYTKVFGPSKYIPLKHDTDLGSVEGSMLLTKVKKIKSTTDNYRLRIWQSDKSVTKDGKYSLEIIVNGQAK